MRPRGAHGTLRVSWRGVSSTRPRFDVVCNAAQYSQLLAVYIVTYNHAHGPCSSWDFTGGLSVVEADGEHD